MSAKANLHWMVLRHHLPKTESYANKNGNKLQWLFGSFGIGLVVFLLYLILPDFIETDGSFRPSTE